MTACPYCAHPHDANARVCSSCGRALVQRCLACAEDIPVLSRDCPLCKASQTLPALAPPASPAPPIVVVGEERNLVFMLILWFLTCGIWGLVAFYQVGSDINAHRRRSDLNPGLDILLGILTCGAWFIYAVYCYSQALKEMSQEEGGPVQDVTAVSTVLESVKYFSGITGIISVMILQSELNSHWRRHRPA